MSGPKPKEPEQKDQVYIFHDPLGIEQGLPHRTYVLVVRSAVEAALGIAECSLSDQFSRKRGRMIAEGRARKLLDKRLLVPWSSDQGRRKPYMVDRVFVYPDQFGLESFTGLPRSVVAKAARDAIVNGFP